jgi:hypothetical protein
MSISEIFETFCSNLKILDDVETNIANRYKQITKRVNIDYWGSESEIYHSLYVGSYGRGTAIHVSDIDIIVQLPYETYERFNSYLGNGQSALIQELKTVLQKTYSKSYVRGDGQVVKIDFADGICFEIVPGFINKDEESFTYPDSNNGGSWKVTNPRAEIRELNSMNATCNHNLKRLCKMARAWKDKWDVPIGGLLIDTLAYNFIKDYGYKDRSYTYYDWMSRDFFNFLSEQKEDQMYWISPGSRQYVWRSGKFEYKAKRCYNLSVEAIKSESEGYEYTAKSKWREIYGNNFPN